jgi:ketosteroid isomerase-like protein
LQPDGKVADTAVAIARFWRILLAKGDTKLRFRLLDAHKQSGMIVARIALSHAGLQQHTALSGGHGGMFIYCVMKQQANGQWKTQIQKWD